MIQVVDNALRVLFAVAAAEGRTATLTSLAVSLGLPKANVLRLLRTLEAHGLVARDDEKRVSLGFSVLRLSAAFQRSVAIGPASLPHLRWLRDACGETATLQIALGRERACVELVESQAELKWAVELGRRFPLASGAAGKVLLAFQVEAAQREVLRDLRAGRMRLPTDAEALERELDEVRRNGYAISVNEMLAGASAVAAPVRDHAGAVVAAISAIGPSERLDARRLKRTAPLVVKASDALAKDLGWRRPLTRAPRHAKL